MTFTGTATNCWLNLTPEHTVERFYVRGEDRVAMVKFKNGAYATYRVDHSNRCFYGEYFGTYEAASAGFDTRIH